ncbi:MAG: hypothetical protein IPH89_01930 [Bacteroidetes bacterium]|nr:hypothetical protein [Bacteroidota bacterium]
MKQLLTLFGVLIFNISYACDFCGSFMGITPYDNQSSIAMLYRYKSYSGYFNANQNGKLFPNTYKSSVINSNSNTSFTNLKHGTHGTVLDSTLSDRDYEVFTTAELRAKYFIHNRIEINGIVPFVMNSDRIKEQKQNIQGIGDITLFAAYHVISKTMTEKYQHRLIIGAGLKLPVGDYYQKNENNQRINFMLQPGTGSVDYLAYVYYVFGYKKIGFSFNSTYKINGENYYHEKIANSSTNYLNVFFKFRQEKDFKIFPSIQGYYEYTEGLFINDVLQAGTTMNIANAGIGLDLFYKQFALNTSFQVPVYEQKINGNMANACKLMVGLTFNFNQKKYLFNKKQTSA